MKKVDWQSVMGQIDDDLLQDALLTYPQAVSLPASPEKETITMKKKHRTIPRLTATAAAIALIFTLGITAYATNLFGILDMDVTLETDPTTHVVNINGYQGTSEYQISVEWENYLDQATNNRFAGTLDPQETNPYWDYSAFSQEAKEELDALLEKYDLKMYQTKQHVSGQKELYETIGTSGFLPDSAGLKEVSPQGNVFDGKSIVSFIDSANLSSGKNVPYDLFRLEKGTFIYTGMLMANAADFAEWNYTTKDGTSVLLCLSEIKAFVLADMGNSFIFLNIRSGSANNDPNRSSYGNDTLTRADLEEFADLFGYAVMGKIS